MRLPALVIGDLTANVPIIQGGMGIGISRSNLAAAVANCGGVGVISGVGIGFDEPDYLSNTKAANLRALSKHIRKAKALSPNGIIGLNLLAALTDYDELATLAVAEKIDLIITGAGLPLSLPKLVEGTNTKIVPIVSSSKADQRITKTWDKKYQRIPDLVILEGPEAGGHLGFSEEQLNEGENFQLQAILPEVLATLKPFEEKYQRKIPVVCAGGIYNGEDIAAHLTNGAAGVQMATRFVATDECDAAPAFKMAYLKAQKPDLRIIKSPVGMPGRAIENAFIANLKNGNQKSTRCYKCLKPCNPSETPYCISEALVNAARGDVDNGLIFAGSNAYKLDRIMPVEELMRELVRETEQSLESREPARPQRTLALA